MSHSLPSTQTAHCNNSSVGPNDAYDQFHDIGATATPKKSTDRTTKEDNNHFIVSTSRMFRAAEPHIPAFLYKLYTMVDDPTMNSFVRWSKSGNSFLVDGHEHFASKILPRFFKHNTFNSFIRQLHMYNFHKIPYLSQGAAASEIWEFTAPFFKKDRPELLKHACRKKNKTSSNNKKPEPENHSSSQPPDYMTLLNYVKDIRKEQEVIKSELSKLRKDNEIIWGETLAYREKHQRHEQVILKLLHLLNATLSNNCHQQEKQYTHLRSNTHSNKKEHTKYGVYFSSPSSSLSATMKNYGVHASPNIPVQTNTMVNFNGNNSGRSIHEITNSIDQLQCDVNSLAYHLGIDPNQYQDVASMHDFWMTEIQPMAWDTTSHSGVATSTTTTTCRKRQPSCSQHHLNTMYTFSQNQESHSMCSPRYSVETDTSNSTKR